MINSRKLVFIFRSIIIACLIFFIGCTIPNNVYGQSANAIITGFVGEEDEGYPITLLLSEADNLGTEPLTEFTAKTDKNGVFQINIPIKLPAYFTAKIYFGGGFVQIGDYMNYTNDFSNFFYLLEPGDSIHLQLKKDTIIYSGRGAEKFWYRQELERTIASQRKGDNNLLYWKKLDSIGMTVLEKNRKLFNDLTYNILKADIIGTISWQRISRIKLIKRDSVTNELGFSRDSLIINEYLERYMPLLLESSPLMDTFTLSRMYFIYLIDLYQKLHYNLIVRNKYRSDNEREHYYVRDIYFMINTFYKGRTREMLLTEFYLRQLQQNGINDELTYYINDYLASDQVSLTFREKLKVPFDELKSRLAPGILVKDFSLPDINGKLYTLNQFRGKVVVLDFWYTGCGPCKMAAPFLENAKEAYKGKDVVFINISIDENKETWKKSIPLYAPGSGISLYTNGKGSEYLWLKYYKIDGYPRFIIIDKKGNIFSPSIKAPQTDNNKELITKINNALNR